MGLFSGRAQKAEQQREAEQNKARLDAIQARWNSAWETWLVAIADARGDAPMLTDQIVAQVGAPPAFFEPSERAWLDPMAALYWDGFIGTYVNSSLGRKGVVDPFWRGVHDYCGAYYKY